MRKFLTAAIPALLLFYACTPNKKPDSQNALPAEQNQTTQPVNAGPADLQPVIEAYSALTHALSENDGESAARAGGELVAPLQALLTKSVAGEMQQKFAAIAKDALENAEHIRDNAGNIRHQREHLDFLSRDLADLASITGSPQVLYKIECGRVNNGEGAFWLSSQKTDNNPYLGKQITDCGEVTEELKGNG